MQNVRRKRMVLDNFAVRKINFSSLIKGFLPVEIMRWKLDFMYPSRSCARGQHRAKTRKQMNDRSWHKKDRPAQTSLSLVDLMGFEPTTSRMRTERARNVVSFLPTDCGVWFDENAGRGADARNTIPQFFNKEGVDSKLICGED